MTQITAIVAAVALAVGFAGGWGVQGWRKDSRLLAEYTARQKAVQEAVDANKAKEAATELAQRTTAELAVERNKEAVIIERVVKHDVIKWRQTPAAGGECIDAERLRHVNDSAHCRVSADTRIGCAPNDASTATNAAGS